MEEMSVRFVNIDHDTPLLLPPDLRDWVSEDHMVHFIMDAVKALDLSRARTNQRGTGHAQYPPSMMLGLLIYCYATGTFASRRIETLTYENVAVRFLTGDTHPDHDSICKFRRENKDLLSAAFHQVLELAARARVLQVGDITVAIDGTKILANASKHSAIQKDRLFLRQGAEKTYGAPTFCRLSDGGHSVTRLPRSDSTDSMSVIQQRAECTRSDIPILTC